MQNIGTNATVAKRFVEAKIKAPVIVNNGGIIIKEEKQGNYDSAPSYETLFLEKPMLLDLLGLCNKYGPYSSNVYFFIDSIRNRELYQLARFSLDVLKNNIAIEDTLPPN